MRVDLAIAQAKHRPQGKHIGSHPYDVRMTDDGGDGGNSTSYLLRRLARERPDVCGRIKGDIIPFIRIAGFFVSAVFQLEDFNDGYCKTSPRSPKPRRGDTEGTGSARRRPANDRSSTDTGS